MMRYLIYIALFSLWVHPVNAKGKKKPSKKALQSFSQGSDTPHVALFHSLDHSSVAQLLSFSELYPETEEGAKAKAKAWELLQIKEGTVPSLLPSLSIDSIVKLVVSTDTKEGIAMTPDQIAVIEILGKNLANRKLKGREIQTREGLLALKDEEIDLARALLIEELGEYNEKVQSYECALDLMALQIGARLSVAATPEEKIRAINQFVFEEMKFRFPPHSLYAGDIDLYTFLPSVLEGRRGVCLGVSILFYSLAQRLDLPLEIVTPPGHIYVRYNSGERVINIETTNRGVHMPSEVYLGVNTRSLPLRTRREVIGMALFNQASSTWAHGDYPKTLALYKRALPYMENDPLLKMLLGIQLVINGEKSEGKAYLTQVADKPFDWAISVDSTARDYLSGHVDEKGLKVLYEQVDETRESVLEKKQLLEKIVKKYPKFRGGLMQLATTWMQLGRNKEAVAVLEKYHALSPTDINVEYYLAALYLHRYDFPKALYHLKIAEQLASERGYSPKVLTHLKKQLRAASPE